MGRRPATYVRFVAVCCLWRLDLSWCLRHHLIVGGVEAAEAAELESFSNTSDAHLFWRGGEDEFFPVVNDRVRKNPVKISTPPPPKGRQVPFEGPEPLPNTAWEQRSGSPESMRKKDLESTSETKQMGNASISQEMKKEMVDTGQKKPTDLLLDGQQQKPTEEHPGPPQRKARKQELTAGTLGYLVGLCIFVFCAVCCTCSALYCCLAAPKGHSGFDDGMGRAVSIPQYLDFQCPQGMGPGDLVQVTLPNGDSMQVTVPPNVYGGMMFSVEVQNAG